MGALRGVSVNTHALGLDSKLACGMSAHMLSAKGIPVIKLNIRGIRKQIRPMEVSVVCVWGVE